MSWVPSRFFSSSWSLLMGNESSKSERRNAFVEHWKCEGPNRACSVIVTCCLLACCLIITIINGLFLFMWEREWRQFSWLPLNPYWIERWTAEQTLTHLLSLISTWSYPHRPFFEWDGDDNNIVVGISWCSTADDLRVEEAEELKKCWPLLQLEMLLLSSTSSSWPSVAQLSKGLPWFVLPLVPLSSVAVSGWLFSEHLAFNTPPRRLLLELLFSARPLSSAVGWLVAWLVALTENCVQASSNLPTEQREIEIDRKCPFDCRATKRETQATRERIHTRIIFFHYGLYELMILLLAITVGGHSGLAF